MKSTDSEIQISRTNSGFRLEAELLLPQTRDKVFELFSDAFQLAVLTPEWVHFNVLTPAPIRIREGTLIDYRLRLRGIPIRWQSRITVWEPPHRFVDEQMGGPYRRWHHEHIFETVEGGTLCRDIVDYAVYGGRLIEKLFVRPDVRKIFTFRQNKLRELFLTSDDLAARSVAAVHH
jgi:ligand-binding SRPBCC domain-containing protein